MELQKPFIGHINVEPVDIDELFNMQITYPEKNLVDILLKYPDGKALLDNKVILQPRDVDIIVGELIVVSGYNPSTESKINLGRLQNHYNHLTI
jgi:hypothetical protein